MRARELGIGGSSVGAVVAAFLLPKCPLCVAAILSALGLGAALPEVVVPLLRPAALAVGLALAVALVAALIARRVRRCPNCPSTRVQSTPE
jgi:hypothetical protein